MERIEKIENIISGDNAEKTLMTISDGNKIKQAEIYLAYIDVETSKRYVVYTTDLDRKENEKATFDLAVMRLEQNGYILEGTDNESHKNIEVKALNVIGLNSGKTKEEVTAELQKALPSISIIDLAALKNNVENMTISADKPPRKANMPMAIANVIKEYYLFELNLELKKIYSKPLTSNEQIDTSVNKLDKIDDKLDNLKNVYEAHAENGKYNRSVEKSLDQIERAKEDIMEAKKSLDTKRADLEQNVEEQGIDLDPELPETNEEDTLENQENYDVTDSIKEETNKLKEEVNKIMQEENIEQEKTVQEEQKTSEVESQGTEQVKEEIESRKQEVINDSVNKFGYSVEAIVNQLTSGISSIYEEKIQQKESENNELREKIKSSENEKGELLVMVENVKNTALEASEKAKNSKIEINNLTNKNAELENENKELKSTVESQKQLLNQQNSNMEALREEGKTRETNLLQEMESLKQEINRLKQYEGAYNQIVGMVTSQKNIDQSENNLTK